MLVSVIGFQHIFLWGKRMFQLKLAQVFSGMALSLMLLLPALGSHAQDAAPASQGVIGAGNYIRVVEDLDRTQTFYYELLGVEPRGGLITREFGPNEPVAAMYNAVGGEFRGVTFPVPNSTFFLEHLEWRGTDRSKQSTEIQDSGNAVLLLFVKDIEQAIASIRAQGGSVVTPGGEAVTAGDNRFILAQDPDGYFIELLQISNSSLSAPGNVLDGRFRLVVGDAEKSSSFYREAMGFGYPRDNSFTSNEILGAINGYQQDYSLLTAQVPGSTLPLELLQYRSGSREKLQQHLPRIGSSMLRIFVSDLDRVVSNALAAGAVLAANNESAVSLNGSRFQIIEDPDGLLLQLVQRPR